MDILIGLFQQVIIFLWIGIIFVGVLIMGLMLAVLVGLRVYSEGFVEEILKGNELSLEQIRTLIWELDNKDDTNKEFD